MERSFCSRNSAKLSLSCIASVFLKRPLILHDHRCCIYILLLSIFMALVLSFQPLQMGKRQGNSFKVNYETRQVGSTSSSSLLFTSLCHRRSTERRLSFSLNPISSDSQLEEHQGTEVISRDMKSLAEWSRSCGIVLADGIELTEDLLGDWSLTTTNSIDQGSYILTVPSQVILTSDVNGDSFLPYYNETDMQNVHDWMESKLESGSQSKQDYLPEFLLVYKLIREVHLGMNSRWYPWLQSLPTQFSTGLYLDEVERNHVKRMTGEYVEVQNSQYQACLKIFQELVSLDGSSGTNTLLPIKFREWMLALQQESNKEGKHFDDLVKWSFTIVFTRSWRSPDQKHAQIVPLGDLANHDSQFANLKPGFRQTDGAFQFFVTNDINVVGSISPKLYLSYGLTYSPARYLVLFGFCDVTAAYIDAQLDFLQDNDDGKWPTTLEASQLVVSTLNGALSEEVWIAFLYKILEEKEPELLVEIQDAYEDNEQRGSELIEKVLDKWEVEVGIEIQSYYQRLLETDFIPIIVTEIDLAEHPNLSMIVNYNLFIRETYLNVLEHVGTFLHQCNEFEALSIFKKEDGYTSRTSRSEDSSISDSKLNSSDETNNDSSVDSTAQKTLSQKSNSNPPQLDPTQVLSPKDSYEESTDISQENGIISSEEIEKANNSADTAQEIIVSDTPSGSSTVDLDQQSFPDQNYQGMMNSNYAPESSNITISQMPYSVGDTPESGSNLSANSLFSFENFRLESYSRRVSASDNANSSEQSYSFDETRSIEIDQQSGSIVPPKSFNPSNMSSTTELSTQQEIGFNEALGNSGDRIESQSLDVFGRKLNPQACSPDQPVQEVNNPTNTSETYFDYTSSQSFSEGLPTTTREGINNKSTSQFPNGDMDSQSDSDSQELLPENGMNATAMSFFRKGNAESRDLSTGQALSKEEMVDTTRTPSFVSQNRNTKYGSEIQSIRTEEGLDYTAASNLTYGDTDLRSDSINQIESSQAGKDFTTFYAESLVMDQRGYSSAQEESHEVTISSNQENNDSPPKPSTYEEYVQQRQEESTLTSGQQHLNTPTTETYAVDDSEGSINDDESINYDGALFDGLGDYQI